MEIEQTSFDDPELLLRETQQIARVGSWQWDLDRDLVTWSAELYRIFGVPPENFDPNLSGYLSLVHPDDRAHMESIIHDTLEKGGDFVVEHRVAHADGSLTWVESRGHMSERDGVLTMRGTAQDITERVLNQRVLEKTERSLRAEREFLVAVLQNLKDGVVACDADGILTIFNKATERIIGQHRKAVPPERWGEVFQAYQPDGKTIMSLEEMPLYRALQGEVVRDMPFVIIPEDGPKRSVTASGKAIYDQEGNKLGAVLTLHDVSERVQARKNLIHRNLHDPLTGLANLSLLNERIARAVHQAHVDQSLVAVVSLDIDDFGAINEEYGHAGADQILVLVANRLTAEGRPHDTLARVGGDEFALLCQGIEREAVAIAIAHRLAAAISAPLVVGDREIALSASIGVAVSNGNIADPTAVFRDAQAALKRARQKGRGHTETFTAEHRAERVKRSDIERELGHAIEEQQLVLEYQPKVLLETYKVIGTEALLRWKHPTAGMIPPLDFIPLAEDTGLIIPIGAWVIEEACRQAARWKEALPEVAVPSVAVNVSGRQFGPELVGVVAQAIATSEIEPEMLTLEVTESLLMDNLASAGNLLHDLKALGISLAIDDFGTGYSSLAYLKTFPIDVLKIDRSFIRGLGTNPEDTAIVAAIMGMAHALGLDVVAEGVETDEQLAQLRVLGCEEAQGFYFFRACSGPKVAAIVERENSEMGPAGLMEALAGHQQGRARSTVLVADDADDVLMLSRASLSAVGFDVREARTGAEALAQARLLRPSCVVLDLSMPDMSGFDVCTALRGDPATAGATIVILTAHGSAEDKARAFSLGADDYIVKPFAPRELVSRVRKAIRRRAEMASG